MSFDADVIIAGGGPAGSTTANLLAAAGHRVIVLEKQPFPRFHIGESLLPIDLPIFERLGVTLEEGEFLPKQGAEFWDERTGQFAEFLFRDGLAGTPPSAFQVERSKFDHVLLLRAAAVGAEVREGVTVREVEFQDDAVVVTTADGAVLRARYFVDATGQDAFSARRRRSMVPLREFGIAAVFCHFDGLSKEASDELYRTGNIRVVIVEDGWIWLIPLRGGRLSCGVVTRRKGVGPELLDAAIAASPMIQGLTRGATRTEARILGNFSYRNDDSHGARWTCVGDAGMFLDPVFSSGVSLAMLGGERLADRLGPALREGREQDPALMEDLSAAMEIAYQSFASLVGSFYHTRIVQNLFFAERPDPDHRAGLISILAGDVFRTDNAFQKMLLSSSRRRFDPFTAEDSADAS